VSLFGEISVAEWFPLQPHTIDYDELTGTVLALLSMSHAGIPINSTTWKYDE
jgi:hypothetical protein